MKYSSRKLFQALAFPLLIGNLTILGMNTPMQLEKKPTPTCVNKEPQLRWPSGWRSLLEIENNMFFCAIGRTFYEGGKTKAYFQQKHGLNGSPIRTRTTWEHSLPTPDRHYSTYDVRDAAFSGDGSKAIFAQYGHDQQEGSEGPGILVALFDLPTQKVSYHCLNNHLGQVCGNFGKIAVSNDGKYCARLLKAKAFEDKPAKTTVIIDELVRHGCVSYSTFEIDHSLDATDIAFIENNTEILVKGSNGNKSFLIASPEGYLIPRYPGHVMFSACQGGRTQHIQSLSLLSGKIQGRVPFIGLCDSELLKKLKDAGFTDVQPEDRLVYSNSLYELTGLKVIPVRYFIQKRTTHARLYDNTQLALYPNQSIKDHYPDNFTFVLFNLNQEQDVIPEKSRNQFVKEIIHKGYVIPTNEEGESEFFEKSFTDGDLTISKVAKSYRLSYKAPL